FVERIGVQGLAAAENRGERLDGHAHDVVFRLLRGKRRTGGLRVETEHHGTRIFGTEAFGHDAGPKTARGAVLGDFFQKIVVSIEEKRKLRGKFIDAEAGLERRLDVGDSIGQSEGDFLDGGRTGFPDVIAGDGDGVPLGKMVAAPRENVRDDAHRGPHRIDVSAAGDVFLQNVILDGAGKSWQARALPFRDGYIEAEQDCGRGVDGHGGGDFFERNALEQSLHVFERIYGHANFADFAEGQGMVRIQANLRGQVESDGKTSLALA